MLEQKVVLKLAAIDSRKNFLFIVIGWRYSGHTLHSPKQPVNTRNQSIMATARLFRPSNNCLRTLKQSPTVAHRYRYTTSASGTPQTSPFAPRHLLSIADLSPQELTALVRNASTHKTAAKSSSLPAHLSTSLAGQSIALTFSKRSTRTRVSTEAAAAMMGAHPMFLGAQDIQLGVNESLYDTSVVISSMVSCIVARVNGHSDVADLAKHS
jgi:ornithine carbamoyltransferase